MCYNWLSQGQPAQGQQYIDTITLEYATMACLPEEAKEDDDEGLLEYPDALRRKHVGRHLRRC